jgi:hypothetical protein
MRRRIAIEICDLALIYIGLVLLAGVIRPPDDPERDCRMAFDDIAEYSALVDLCKDHTVGAALIEAQRRHDMQTFYEGASWIR